MNKLKGCGIYVCVCVCVCVSNSQVALVVKKEPSCQFRRWKREEFGPWVEKIPWRRKWLPTPVFLPGEYHG